MPLDPFPQDIFDEIVDWAAQDFPESLSNLSLASKELLLKRCQRYIFRNTYFAEPLWLPPGTWKVFRKNPSLLSNVRQVTVQHRLPGFKVTEDEFTEILGRLQDIEALEIDVRFEPEDWIKYEVFTRWPQLVHLTIQLSGDLPLNLFYALPHLQELRLIYNSYPKKPVINESDFTALPWKLKALHYHPETKQPYNIHPMPLLERPIWESQVYSDLRYLSLVIGLEEHHRFAFARALPACIDSPLEALRLRYGHDCRDLYGILVPDCLAIATSKGHTLPSFESLRYLSVGLASHKLREDTTTNTFGVPRHQPDFISQVLGAASQPALEALELVFSWYIVRGQSESQLAQELLIARDLGWDGLDSILSDHARFPQLRAVRVRMTMEEFRGFQPARKYRSTDDSELGRVLREQLLDVFANARGSGLVFDVGLKNSEGEFDRVTKPTLGAAWRYKPM